MSGAKRPVLVATLGLAPQVLTETVYALATRRDPFVPQEIHIVTTAPGRERVLNTLIGGRSPRLEMLAAI